MKPTTQTMAADLARFVTDRRYEDLSQAAYQTLKIRILDSLGCALGALGSEPVAKVHRYIDECGGSPICTLIGGGRSTPEGTALYNGFLIRYLDFNDSYLAPRETCHPSDNLAPILAATEYVKGDGRTLLVSLGIAYQVQCRLSEEAPVRDKGFDHTVQGNYAASAGISKALGLDKEATTNALAIAGTAFNALRVTRTGKLSHWKGLAYPNTAFCCMHAALLARQGITGPQEVFEGNKGFMHSIAGPFELDWVQEDLERVTRTIIKKYNAEIHSQSVLEGLEELQNSADLSPEAIARIDLEVFDVCYKIIGGGEEGDKTLTRNKEEADHSLPYMAAAMLIDGEVTPRQYTPERMERGDIQALMSKIKVTEGHDLSYRFPSEMPCRIKIALHDGTFYQREKADYKGFHNRPASWEETVHKFRSLTPQLPGDLQNAMISAVADLENITVSELTQLLHRS